MGSAIPETKDVARLRIVQAANRFILDQSRRRWPPFPARLVGVQQAVHVCRQNLLVADDVLVAAGYRPARKAA